MIPIGLFVLGYGGHARSMADVALDCGIGGLSFVSAEARLNEQFAGYPVVTKMPDRLPDGWAVVAGAGSNLERKMQIERAEAEHLPLFSLLSKRAYVGVCAGTGTGCFVAHHAHIGPMVSIGRGVIVNTAAVVDHDCAIGDFTHVSVNATVAGRCRIGSLVFLGAGSTVIDGVRIADDIIVGAGSTVVDDLDAPGIYVGSPARRVDRSSCSDPTGAGALE